MATKDAMEGLARHMREWHTHTVHYHARDRKDDESKAKRVRVSNPNFSSQPNATFDIHVRDPVLSNQEDSIGEMGDQPINASFSDDSRRIMVICAAMVVLGGVVWMLTGK